MRFAQFVMGPAGSGKVMKKSVVHVDMSVFLFSRTVTCEANVEQRFCILHFF